MLDATVNKSGGKSLMPPPADTLEFAQSRRADLRTARFAARATADVGRFVVRRHRPARHQ